MYFSVRITLKSTIMLLKLVLSCIAFSQNQELTLTAASELATDQKAHNLSQLITILSLTILTLIILLSINIYKNYKLRTTVKNLESRLK